MGAIMPEYVCAWVWPDVCVCVCVCVCVYVCVSYIPSSVNCCHEDAFCCAGMKLNVQ